MGLEISDFQRIALTNPASRRIVEDSGSLTSPDDARTWKFFCAAKSFDRENTIARTQFAGAMLRTYGAANPLPEDFVGARSLSSRDISQHIALAEQARLAWVDAWPGNHDTDQVQAQGWIASNTEALAGLDADARMRLAARSIYHHKSGTQPPPDANQMGAMSPMQSHDIAANQATPHQKSTVDAIIAHLEPAPRSLALYRGMLKNALLAIDLASLPEASREAMLRDLAGKLADNLETIADHAVRRTIPKMEGRGSWERDTDISRAIAAYAQKPAAFYGKYPGLLDIIETECAFFASNMTTMLSRVGDGQGAAELFTRCGIENMGDTPRLTGIQITGSDPHNQGKRVLILTFRNGDDEAKLVYKPRDCRVDEKIIGSARVDGGFESVASTLNEGLGAHEIPTYHYLTKEDAAGRYGLVQYLSHSNENPHDYLMKNDEHARNFYLTMGMYQGLCLLCGLTDMHQGNFIVSGGKPYATDLEMAFSRSVLGEAGSLPRGGSTMMDKAVRQSTEQEQRPSKIILLPTHNFLVGEDGRPIQTSAYGDRIKEGFELVMNTAARQEVNNIVRERLLEFDGMHVRLHPLATSNQLMTRMELREQIDKPMRKVVDEKYGGIDQPQTMTEMDPRIRADGRAVHAFYVMARKDWAVGDVAYFTRELHVSREAATAEVAHPEPPPVFHNNVPPAVERQLDVAAGVDAAYWLRDDGADVAPFAYQGLERALEFLGRLPDLSPEARMGLIGSSFAPPAPQQQPPSEAPPP